MRGSFVRLHAFHPDRFRHNRRSTSQRRDHFGNDRRDRPLHHVRVRSDQSRIRLSFRRNFPARYLCGSCLGLRALHSATGLVNRWPARLSKSLLSIILRQKLNGRSLQENSVHSGVYGGAGESRTPDLRFRKPPLYPSELQPRHQNPVSLQLFRRKMTNIPNRAKLRNCGRFRIVSCIKRGCDMLLTTSTVRRRLS